LFVTLTIVATSTVDVRMQLPNPRTANRARTPVHINRMLGRSNSPYRRVVQKKISAFAVTVHSVA